VRIKIFEKLLPLESVFETIIKSLKPKYRISDNSQIFKKFFLIIAHDSKNFIFVIRGAPNNSKNRIILSIVALGIKSLFKLLKLKNNMKLIENHLYDLIMNNDKENSHHPFEKISIDGKDKSKYKKKNLIAEKNILNELLEVFYEKFNYNDDLIKFPFSIFNIDRTWEFWVKIYGPYLKQIETTILTNYNDSIKTYKYYDFGVPKEIFPRIIDLIIIENCEKIDESINIKDLNDQKIENKESDEIAQTDDNIKKQIKWIGFIYAYKKLKPMGLIDVLKLSEEVIKFVDIFKKRSCNKGTEIKPVLIFLSIYGYEKRIGKYLRDHLHHDYKRFIPIFIVPPINNEIWHNFNANKGLSQEDKAAKNRAKRYINLYKKDSKIYTYIKHNIQDAKENYSEILDREKEAKDNFEFVKKWYNILNIDKSNEQLNIMDDKNKIKDEINILND
jgi:hypothetical protein